MTKIHIKSDAYANVGCYVGLCVRAPFTAICDDENIFRRDTQQYSRKGLNNCELMSCNCNIVKSNEHCLKDVKRETRKVLL